MKWDGDKYKEVKWLIFDLLRDYLDLELQEKISISNLTNEIDKMFVNLNNIPERLP